MLRWKPLVPFSFILLELSRTPGCAEQGRVEQGRCLSDLHSLFPQTVNHCHSLVHPWPPPCLQLHRPNMHKEEQTHPTLCSHKLSLVHTTVSPLDTSASHPSHIHGPTLFLSFSPTYITAPDTPSLPPSDTFAIHLFCFCFLSLCLSPLPLDPSRRGLELILTR